MAEEKISFILENIKYLSKAEYIKIIHIVINSENLSVNSDEKLKSVGPISDHADGIRINCSELNISTINEIFMLVSQQIK